jgi:hypothetical protein
VYDISKTDYGLRLAISGQMSPEEATEYGNEVRSAVDDTIGSFCVFADLREMDTLPQEATEQIGELMGYCKNEGMERSVSVVDTAVDSMQFMRLSEAAGIDERVINAAETDTWEEDALAWLTEGVEP